ncbi:MAG: TerB family tellurite resistance protein [Xenococcaceae cyanobacterium MO_167.B52]|nr:TerB family tellurite resistance protein [Xenococcaceae cyanobacterium MO_167.B52]
MGVIETLKALLVKHEQKIRSQKFLEAAMAATAMLALADGEISFAELMARDYILDQVRELQVFEPNEAVELFRTYAETISLDPEKGEVIVDKAITQLCGDEELASLLLRICLVMAKADRDLSQQEQKVINGFCDILGLDKGEINLKFLIET